MKFPLRYLCSAPAAAIAAPSAWTNFSTTPTALSAAWCRPPRAWRGFPLHKPSPATGYNLQTSTNLAAGSWLAIDDPVSGDGVPIVSETPYDPAKPRRFYRILISR